MIEGFPANNCQALVPVSTASLLLSLSPELRMVILSWDTGIPCSMDEPYEWPVLIASSLTLGNRVADETIA